MKPLVDDHLDLLSRSFGDARLIVFTGISGSGKSTCVNLLLDEHPEFIDRDRTVLGPTPIDWPRASPPTELVVVDELLELRELGHVIQLLRTGHLVIAASHLPPIAVRLCGLAWPIAHFRTDQSIEKLERHLIRQGVVFSAARLRAFIAAHGASYTDLDIVMERSPGIDFDRAFERFERSARIERRRCVGSTA